MRIYMFKSESKPDLRAFAGDIVGSMPPENHGPWTATGIIGTTSVPTHNISRLAIEEAIGTKGFQESLSARLIRRAPCQPPCRRISFTTEGVS
jgi:hypothetical protein